jgi:hypothetical protein
VVQGVLGRGGMGVVLRARDERVGREVAIKLLLRGREADEAARQRFLREGATLSKIRHHHVVAVHDAGESDGVPYLVLDLVEGESLHEKTARSGPLPPLEVAQLGAQIADGLEAAHSQGVLHRDLKPDNILLEEGGRALLTDFGLAKDLDRLGETQRLTQSSVYMGTPGYWSPEQASGKPDRITRASDVFGLGATLYGLLTGRAPFEAPSFLALVVVTMEEDPPPLSREIPAGLRAVVEACLAKDPHDRYPSAEAVGEDLRRIAAGQPPVHVVVPPPPAPRRVMAGLVVAILALLLIPLSFATTDSAGSGSLATTPSPTQSVRVGPRAAELWSRYHDAFDAGDLELASRALEEAHAAGSKDALAVLGKDWVKFSIRAPRGPQLRLQFLATDPPLLVLVGVENVMFWDLRRATDDYARIAIPPPGWQVVARAAPRVAYLARSEVVVEEIADWPESRVVWRRPLMLNAWDHLCISPGGTRVAYVSNGRLYVEDVDEKAPPYELPAGMEPDLDFLDEDTLRVVAGNVDPIQSGWVGLLDLRQTPLRLRQQAFADSGVAGQPGWLFGASAGWSLVLSGDPEWFQVVPPSGAPQGFSYPWDSEREAPPMTFTAARTPPLFLALQKPERGETPLEVHAFELGRLRLLRSRLVESGSDAIAISADERMVAVGDGTTGSVVVYLTGGRATIR